MANEKNQEGQIKSGAAKEKLFFEDDSDCPNETDGRRQEINQDHFIKLEKFFIDPSKKERGYGQKNDEKPAENGFKPRIVEMGGVSLLHRD